METAVRIGIICLAALNVADGAITWSTPPGGDTTKADIKEGTEGTIYTFAATATGALTYTLVRQSVPNTFTFSSGALNLKTGSKLDFETNPTLEIEVRAVEAVTPPMTSTGTVTINLVDVNEAPTFSHTAVTRVVSAGLTTGDVIDTVQFTDQDAGDTVTHSFMSGNCTNDLVIGTTSGEITVASGKTLVSSDQYALVIKAVDSNATPLSSTAVYYLCGNGANDLTIGANSGIITVASGKTLVSSDQYELVIKAVDSNATPLQNTMAYKLCVVSCDSSAGTLVALGLMTLLSTLLTYLA